MPLLYDDNDILVGKSLFIWGQKFSRVKKQNFIKVIGSCGAEIKSPVTDKGHIEIIKKTNKGSNIYTDPEFGFDKRTNLICEPESQSDCPTAKGTDDHGAKKHGHTPKKKYTVDSEEICAFAYLDLTRQSRKLNIALKEVAVVGPDYELSQK